MRTWEIEYELWEAAEKFWLVYSQIVAHFLLILGVTISVAYFFYVELVKLS